MKIKLLEVRDSMTFLPVLCIDMNPGQPYQDGGYSMAGLKRSLEEHSARTWLLRRCGYPCNAIPMIAMTALHADGGPCDYNPHRWGDRTRTTAHKYIVEHWDELRDGDVVDVEFILGETSVKKESERVGF